MIHLVKNEYNAIYSENIIKAMTLCHWLNY